MSLPSVAVSRCAWRENEKPKGSPLNFDAARNGDEAEQERAH